MATINSPVGGYTGTVAGVEFADGAADTDDPKAIAYFVRRGYVVDGVAQVGTPLADVAESGQPEAFDPSDHTVAEVNDHLAEGDQAERDRVLAAEKAGKDRTTVHAPTD